MMPNLKMVITRDGHAKGAANRNQLTEATLIIRVPLEIVVPKKIHNFSYELIKSFMSMLSTHDIWCKLKRMTSWPLRSTTSIFVISPCEVIKKV